MNSESVAPVETLSTSEPSPNNVALLTEMVFVEKTGLAVSTGKFVVSKFRFRPS
jgi:hypothetical protein